MHQEESRLISFLKKGFVGLCLTYAVITHLFLSIALHKQGYTAGGAMIAMALTMIVVWIVIGGWVQRKILAQYYEWFTKVREHPVRFFALFATALACLEELVTVTLTNLAPLYGVPFGTAYITASGNYFDVIFLHSVIAFVPMFVVLGFILKKYAISPFGALILWGIVGTLAEVMFGGPQALLNAGSWIFVYGLMVYLPAHVFVNMERKKPLFLLYPIFILMIIISSLATIWIPAMLDHPSIHFEKMELKK